MTIHDILFSLLRLSLGTRADEMDFSALTNADWKEVIDLSFGQGVAALSVDGLGFAHDNDDDNDDGLELRGESLELSLDSPELEDLKYEWFGACFENEQTYEEHLKVIEKLALLYNEQSVRMLLLKGYGLSLNYPVPEHRTSGDIDIYLYGKGGLGISSSLFPDWPRDKRLEARVLEEILAPRKVVKSLAGKVYRFFAAGWKYRMVYNDNMLMSSFRLAKSYLRLKDDTAESIWEKEF